MVFAPKRSYGWVWLVVLALYLLFAAFLLGLRPGAPPVALLIAAPTALLGAWSLYLAALFPTMRYEVADGELRLRYGPMCWRLPVRDIRSVRKADLTWTIWSSWRFPGFALFRIPYGNVGTVRMCSTRCLTGVLLIETAEETYGVSPEDEGGLLAALASSCGPRGEEGDGVRKEGASHG